MAVSSYTPLEPSFAQDAGMSNMLNFSTETAIPLFTSISFLWTLGIVACVAGAGFVWVRGGLYRMEASEAGIRKSNEEFKRGSLGLLGVMALFLIIYTVNKGLLVGDVGLANLRLGGSSAVSAGGGITPLPNPAGTTPGGNTLLPSRIYTAAMNAKDRLSSFNAPGTNNGRLACAWAVNEVLKSAGISPIGSLSVAGMESALRSGRGTQLDQASTVPGDIAVQAGASHVGICLNQGCTRVISNASGPALFSWVSGPDFAPSYTGGVGRFYRVNN